MNKRLRILFLEDVPSEVTLVDHALRKAGLDCQIQRVDTKKEFIDGIAENPDVILSDHGLVSFDGCMALRIAQKKCPSIPFIFVTDSLGSRAMQEAERGATDHVLKRELSKLASSICAALMSSATEHDENSPDPLLSKTDFRSLVENLKGYAIIELDEQGRITFWGAGARELYGFEAREMRGRSLALLHPPDENFETELQSFLNKVLQTGSVEEQGLRVSKMGEIISVQSTTIAQKREGRNSPRFVQIAKRVNDPESSSRAITQADERYHQMVERTPCSLLVINRRGRILYANRSAINLLRARTMEELLACTFQKISPPDNGRKILERIREAHGAGVEFIEHELVRLDGTRLPVEMSATTVLYAERPQLEITIHDIARRKATERALAEKEQHLRSILETALDAIISIDSKGMVQEWNPAAERIFGFKRDEAMGEPVDELIVPESLRQIYRSGLGHYLVTGACSLVGRPVELTLRRANGEEFRAELSITRNGTEDAPWCTALLRDITERQEAQAELKKSEERFRLMVEGVTDYAIYMLDAAGRVETWNTGAERLEGYTAEEIIGQHFSTFFLPDDIQAGVPAVILERAESDGHVLNEGWRVRKDGTRFWSRGVVTALRNEDGKLRGFAKVAQDLTRRKQNEDEILRLNATLEQRVADRTAQLQAANEELEAFSYSVSHDLRSPLRHITGYVEILRADAKGKLEENTERFVGSIAHAASHMAELIEGLLAFSQLGRAEMHRSNVQLGSLVEQIRRELNAEIKDRNVEWRIGPLPTVRGDVLLLRQAMRNLMENALKYTRPRDPAKIEIGTQADRDEIIIFFRDNGVGFDMQYADKLFGVFQRLHRPKEFEGTGIGLANVRRVIHRHGGRTWASGKVDRGATFYISLPKPRKGV